MKYAGICLCMALLCVNKAQAIAPRYMSDQELAESSIIVVAQWEKASVESHNRYRENEDLGPVIIESEAYTKLRIVRTVKGAKLKPGQYDLKVGWGISWSKDGTWLSSGTSTELPGDVQDITKPSLWFLNRERSWDEAREDDYLSIDNYRQIQPLGLDGYFLALGGDRPKRDVPLLLSSDQPEEVRRALLYVCGGHWPWPHDSDFERRYLSPDKRGEILSAQANAVAKVVERKDLGELRSLAVTVYAELKQEGCVNYVRELLRDEDADVRAMAVCVLARNRDEKAIGGMIQAVNGITNGWMSCRVIESLGDWGDDRLVPALIAFLENGDSAGFAGDDLFIPAIKSRQVLLAITGHVFPFEADSSLKAWDKAQHIADASSRGELLAQLIPCDAQPLKAELVGSNNNAYLRLTNTSRQPTTVTRHPSYGHQRSPGASFGCGFGQAAEVQSEKGFVTLKPGDSIQLSVELRDRFLLASPDTREMSVVFDNTGSAYGINAWIGNIKVSFGEDWQEERVIKNVEEKWPNGNLKAAGQTVNGERFGEWNFFNEQGDRTKIIHYASNRGSATCNPEHPSNKGAGKRKN